MDIKDQIGLLKTTRQRLLDVISDEELAYLVKIPKGFNNNIFWNVAHCVVTQQLLHYKLSNTEMRINDFWVDHFRKGSDPADVSVGDRELIQLKDYLVKSSEWLEKDYLNEKFGVYSPYKTSFGVELDSLEKAITFNNIHEGLHLGYIMALKKSL